MPTPPCYLPFWRRFSVAAAVLAATILGGLRGAPTVTNADNAALTAETFKPTAEDDAFLEELEQTAFRYFIEQSHPITGLTLDRAPANGTPGNGKASIAASGFALTALAIGVERGWIDRTSALQRCRTQLRFLATKAPRVHGFFYHFMDADTGARAWQCELSTIDTGLFLAGALMAREYFQDPEITSWVNLLYGELDWAWFLNGGPTFAMGWRDETGFSRFRWSAYSELMMLTLLGLGATHDPIPPEIWSAWSRGPVGAYGGYRYIQHPSLFVHQFTHAYIQFRDQRDAYADYHRNSVLATLAHREFCAELASEFPSWKSNLWGVTASDSAHGYKGGWGGPPRTFGSIALDGTIVPCAAAGSLPFTPKESLQLLRHIRAVYGQQIWQHYGFVDAFNPETGWVNPDVIGIDLGILLVQAENLRTNFVHQVFMGTPEVKHALARAGFLSTDRTLSPAQRGEIRSFAQATWQSLASTPPAPETAGLQLSAFIAAHTLGLLSGSEARSLASTALRQTTAPLRGPALAQYAAGLILLRQFFPALRHEVAARLEAVDWRHASILAGQLGSADRLTVFFQIATGARPPSAWNALERQPILVGSVYALVPATLADQFIPGLWLDEHEIITGASAAQLAYAEAIAAGSPPTSRLGNLLSLAACFDRFPTVALAALQNDTVTKLLATASVRDRSAALLSVANLLGADQIRTSFQRDPLVQAGRAAIPEFAAAEFGAKTSSFWRNELAGPAPAFPARVTIATTAEAPREQWHWLQVKGLDYRDSSADLRPGDPELSMRFAFTWDAEALYFHATVVDGLPSIVPQPGEHNGIELFIDPKATGLRWAGPGSYQFVYRTDGTITEAFHRRATTATLRPVAGGYSLEARIAWSELELTPRPGLELAVSPAVIAEGRAEWEPALKLNWSYHRRADDLIELGRLRLE